MPDTGHWWSPFLKKDIRHCYLLVPSGENLIQFEKVQRSVALFTVNKEKSIIEDNYIMVSWEPKECSQPLFMLNTCVGHIKQVLGINKPFIWTPYQLLKYLRKSNEKPKSA
jgi:hypothetical protein